MFGIHGAVRVIGFNSKKLLYTQKKREVVLLFVIAADFISGEHFYIDGTNYYFSGILPCTILIPGLFFIPESPRWLVSHQSRFSSQSQLEC